MLVRSAVWDDVTVGARRAPAATASSPTACAFRTARATSAARSCRPVTGRRPRASASTASCSCGRFPERRIPERSIDDMSNQVADAAGQRERIDAYLERSGLARHVAARRAAHRRRLRPPLLPRPLPDAPSIVLSLYAGPVRLRHAVVRQRRAAARADAGPDSRPCSAMPAISGVLALEDLGDVTLQAHLGAAIAGRARGALPAGRGAHRDAAAPRRRARESPTTCPTASPSTSRS